MFIALDAKGEQITASITDLHDGYPVVSVEVTNLIGLANSAWLYSSAARELAAAILARCDEIDAAVAAKQAADAEFGQLITDLRQAVSDYQSTRPGDCAGGSYSLSGVE